MCASSFQCAVRSPAGARGRETWLRRRGGLKAEFHCPVVGGEVEESGQLCLGTGHAIRIKKALPSPNNSRKGVRELLCVDTDQN